MEARLVPVVLVAVAFFSLGANYRTSNFMVTARSPEFAKQVGDQAEVFRKKLSIEFTGRELGPWREPCPITVTTGANLGAAGETSFGFINGTPVGWTMSIQGSPERVLDAVLPHEVLHTIFATHFGRPLPRWADEGACTTVEHISERQKQDRFLIEFLSARPSRGIPFNKMFVMKQYPRDVMPLYSQGYSVTRFLIHQGGKPKFVEFVGAGMQRNDWNTAVAKYYGYKDLSELQLKWLEFVKAGSPDSLPHNSLSDIAQASRGQQTLVSNTPPSAAVTPVSLGGSAPNTGHGYQSEAAPVQPAANHLASQTANPSNNSALFSAEPLQPADSWYRKQRDTHQQRQSGYQSAGSVARPQPIGRPQQAVLR